MYNTVICSFQQSLLRTIKHVYIYIFVCVCLYIDLCTFIFSISTLSFEFVFVWWCVYTEIILELPCCLYFEIYAERKSERKWMNESGRSDYVIWFVLGLFFLVRSGIRISKRENRSSSFSSSSHILSILVCTDVGIFFGPTLPISFLLGIK